MRRLYSLPGKTLIFAILLLVGLAAACTSEATPTATPTARPVPTSPPAQQPIAPPAQQPTAAAPAPTAAASPAPVATATVAAIREPQAPKTPAGTLLMAWNSIPAGPGINSAQAPETMMAWGVTELFFRREKDNPVSPWLATGFELAPDQSKVTVKFRDGVQFHKGYGELSAADVAWSLNDTNAATNPQSIHGQAGDYAPLFKEAKALDKNTLEIPLVGWDVRFASYFMNQSGDGFGIFSKKAFDEKGAEWMRENVVATGPFEVMEWRRNDKVTLRAVTSHWDRAAQIKEMRFIEVPEGQSRVAMLLTGEADVSYLPTKDLVDASRNGYVVKGAGRSYHVAIPIAGNYWETKHAITGAPLDTAGIYVANIPWVGNPKDEKDMEQARKVRWGLATAIDRDTIAKQSFADIAKPLYIGSFFPEDSHWNDKWKVNYDVASSEKFFEEAGFPRRGGATGNRFSMPLFGMTNNQLFFEVSEIVAGYWRKVGVDTSVLHYDYSVFRPTMVQRANTTPVVMTCRQNNGGAPWDWPRMEEYTSLTRGGFGCGMEIPFVLETYQKISKETDEAKRIELNNALADYVHHWMLEIGVSSVPDAIAYNPRSIKSWDMRPGIFLVVNSPELIVPAR